MTSIKARKKPVIVEAIQWTGNNLQDIINFTDNQVCEDEGSNQQIYIEVWNSLEQQYIYCPEGHYIIKGIKGEFYPCEPEVFYATYDIVEA